MCSYRNTPLDIDSVYLFPSYRNSSFNLTDGHLPESLDLVFIDTAWSAWKSDNYIDFV